MGSKNSENRTSVVQAVVGRFTDRGFLARKNILIFNYQSSLQSSAFDYQISVLLYSVSDQDDV